MSHVDNIVPALGIVLSDRYMDQIEAACMFDFGYPHTALSGTMGTTDRSKGVAHPSENSRLNKLGWFDWVGKLRAIGTENQ